MRDLIWPMSIGRNHLGGAACRIGVSVVGGFSWLDAEEWQISHDSEGVEEFASNHSPIAVTIRSWVSEADCLHRSLELRPLGDFRGPVRIFFSHDFSIDESSIGDTVFFHPASSSVVHHKRSVALAFGARGPNGGIARVASGLKRVGGLEGTFRDAEDGGLHEKLIEQGSVDSTFCVEGDLVPGTNLEIAYWLCAASSIREATLSAIACQSAECPKPVPERLPNGFAVLPDPVCELAQRSIAILRALTAENGAILAACDSDIMVDNLAHYAYVWPRDGAIVANVFDRLGNHGYSARYFEFCKGLICDEQPYFFQKYNTDGTVGSTWLPWQVDGEPVLPLQEDETALTLWSYGHHLRGSRSMPGNCYATFVRPMANFLSSYVDRGSGLPLPSHDLWEERRGVHSFTACSVVAALHAASDIAIQAGESSDAGRYLEAAAAMAAAICTWMVDRETGALLRSTSPVSDPTADAASLLSMLLVDLDDRALLENTIAHVRDRLWIRDGVGGLARYEGDWYWRKYDDLPGNPWVITTLWLARAEVKLANSIEGLTRALELLSWVVALAEPTGVMSEQYDPRTGDPISVSPLAWSHAEFLHCCLDWVEKREALSMSAQK